MELGSHRRIPSEAGTQVQEPLVLFFTKHKQLHLLLRILCGWCVLFSTPQTCMYSACRISIQAIANIMRDILVLAPRMGFAIKHKRGSRSLPACRTRHPPVVLPAYFRTILPTTFSTFCNDKPTTYVSLHFTSTPFNDTIPLCYCLCIISYIHAMCGYSVNAEAVCDKEGGREYGIWW
ncbi:hypothetical protein DL89DRAFT_98067 [Linderina pennispora]|uniref:Uncharacterized protein n=1 Tax=Linderina pennispora TaxID=61395 RepID=A0A1Y1VWK8_9FUNG|nr:uncharacterized protein DL89DRAFT_98067 [Linderina pennispora]ORX65670.1 hypothetical protein DL89DRAFT_98067 [Linderina pennispora]